MRALISGGCGFIGSALVKRLIMDHHHVLNLDVLNYAANLDSVAEVAKNPLYTFVHGSVCDQKTVDACFRDFLPDRVFHLAAESHVDRSIRAPVDFIETNVGGTFRMLEGARKAWTNQTGKGPFLFVQVSTDEVYGSAPSVEHFDESAPYRPNSPYSASKAAADHMVRAWTNTYGMPSLTVHPSNNFGPWQHWEKLVPKVISCAVANKAFPLHGDGHHIREWTHVEATVINMLNLCTTWDGTIGEHYNIGSGIRFPNVGFVTSIWQMVNEEIGGRERCLLDFVDDRLGNDRRYAMNSQRAITAGARASTQPIFEKVHATVRWYLEHRDRLAP